MGLVSFPSLSLSLFEERDRWIYWTVWPGTSDRCAKPKKLEGPTFTICICTENQDQASFCSSATWEVSGLHEEMCYALIGVPSQSNSPGYSDSSGHQCTVYPNAIHL